MGRLLEFVVAHEVGHTIGFQHNMKSSSLYPAEKVRDPEWLHNDGPRGVDHGLLALQLRGAAGRQDSRRRISFRASGRTTCGPPAGATRRFPERTRRMPKADARRMGSEQDKTPWLRFSNQSRGRPDPGENIEAVGDADAVYSTELGMKNLQRVMALLLAATSRPGEPYDDLKEMYKSVLAQWGDEMYHVVHIVGGVETQEKHAGQDGVRFTPVSRERQIAAVRFLNESAFQTPTFLLRPEVMQRMEPTGALDAIKQLQMGTLQALLDDWRFSWLIEQETTEGAKAYRPAEFLADVRKGIWRELDAPNVRIDGYRRNLQRGYIELLTQKVNGRSPSQEESRAFFRVDLKDVSAKIASVLPKVMDPVTKAHLEDVRDQITKALDPKFLPPEPKPSFPFGFRGASQDLWNTLGCWDE